MLFGMGAALVRPSLGAVLLAQSRVTTIIGTGTPGNSGSQVANPYGLVIGPDNALYFCDLDNQRLRRLDLKTRALTTIAETASAGTRATAVRPSTRR